MKHGIVTNGRTTTYYGNAATDLLVRQTAAHTYSKKEAIERLRASSSVSFFERLVEALKRVNSTFTEKELVTLRKHVEKEAARREAEALANRKADIRRNPKSKTPTTSRCMLCMKTLKGSEYYDGGRGHRTHVVCAEG